VHEQRTHLANVLLALQLLQRWVPPSSPQALAVRAGLASARALIVLLFGRASAGAERPEDPNESSKEWVT
jgi:hypothetical protein